MILKKYTTAWEVLDDMADEDGSLGHLLDLICDAGKTDALEHLVSDEFPNGVDEEELREYFENEQREILDNLGIEDPEDGEEA